MRRAELVALIVLAAGCDPAGPADLAAPVDPAQMGEWLSERSFEDWEGESSIRGREGGGGAQVFISPRLAESLEDGRTAHPRGAAAVRVLYENDLATVLGFAVAVKVEDGPVDPGRWLWYEVFDEAAELEPSVAQRAAPGCIGCHEHGHDFVQSIYPLR